MNKLVALSPQNIAYVENKASLFGKKHKFSEALNFIIEEHKKMKSLSEIKNEILSLRADIEIRETSSGTFEVKNGA
jgi:hypothetical protein